MADKLSPEHRRTYDAIISKGVLVQAHQVPQVLGWSFMLLDNVAQRHAA